MNRLEYTCGQCQQILPAGEEWFFPSALKRAAQSTDRSVIGQCKACAQAYARTWRKAIRDRGLTRSQKNIRIMSGAVTGTVYVIGPDQPGCPYKIGITSGSDTKHRKTSLQTAHWMDLKLIWASPLLDRADLVETYLHQHFAPKRVRGEWFMITQEDIAHIPNLVKQYGELDNE